MTTRRIRRAWDASILAGVGRRVAAGSALLCGARRVGVHVRNLVNRLTGVRLPPPLERAIERSTVAGLEREIEHAVRVSSLYRWFTTEPDSDVIVVDLRESYTIGSIMALLGRLEGRLGPVWQSDTFWQVRAACVRVVEITARSRTARKVVILLAPPEPPEDQDGYQ